MKIIEIIKKRWKFLIDPLKGFSHEIDLKFETVVYEYIVNLVLLGICAGAFIFISSFVKSGYYDLFYKVDIQYIRMINYTFGQANGLIFAYLFSGLFGLFIVSIILGKLSRGVKYTKTLHILFLSLAPILLFGWVPQFLPGLIIWSIILYIIGRRQLKAGGDKKVSSITQRD